MKSILISIKPKYCELICSGEKTVEVRKTRPKCETPFKVYIYETQGRTETPFVDEEGHHIFKGRGQVIGEFVCDKIDKIFQCNSGWVQEHACISREEYFKYLGLPYNSHFDSKGAYAWHISDLVIYDEPRELGEFAKPAKTAYDDEGFLLCDGCEFANWNIERVCTIDFCPERMIARAPQSWCYIEPRQTAD